MFVTACTAGARALAVSVEDPRTSFALHSLTWALTSASSFLWLLFLATLPSRILRPLRTPWVWGALAACSVLVAALWPVALREHIILGVYEAADRHTQWFPLTLYGFVSAALPTLGSLVVSVLGLVVAWDLFRSSARGSQSRRQAKAYLVAFGVHDVLYATTFGVLLWMWNGGGWANWTAVMHKPEAGNAVETFLRATMFGGWYAGILAISLLPPHAVLRTQLFDIDLRVKWGLRRGTVVAAFVAAFLVASAVADRWLDQYGTVVGGVAAGVMLLAIRPIERAAERIANAAMPAVRDTDEYRTVRKREVYRAAVEAALEDGTFTDRERSMLATLQDQLGIAAKDALAIEREARETSRRAGEPREP